MRSVRVDIGRAMIGRERAIDKRRIPVEKTEVPRRFAITIKLCLQVPKMGILKSLTSAFERLQEVGRATGRQQVLGWYSKLVAAITVCPGEVRCLFEHWRCIVIGSLIMRRGDMPGCHETDYSEV